ncbi:serpin family protein [Streptomyces roseicoloratus]|uniref:Serpin family protein n=1 Tax=Streptomyces roseicoloratus TaxID=2508722 RepID=A0ABY9RU86_9ACTN|nr:serpin family protein [Streptomyces roseicoloratus]WMX45238.1 serpin family protein [Streptomyces roseicoloratus]
MRGTTVRAVNRLTARWAGALPGGTDTVLSATGVWPLLAFLADAADGPARGELEEALGLPAGPAAEAARELLAGLGRMRGVGSAIGLWTRPSVALREDWTAGLPEATLERLGEDDEDDERLLDAWADKHTGGLIPRMPLSVDKDTELVLASAQAVRTGWLRPFDEDVMRPELGPWAAGRRLEALSRTTTLLDRVGVAETGAGPLTVLQVLGDTGVDVHLLLGPEEAGSGAVLKAGLDVLAGTFRAVPGTLLPTGEPGPGLTVRNVRSTSRDPYLTVTTSPFSLEADHDLLALHGLFGLTTARDATRGHFPGVAERPPLCVRGARQAAMARFGAKGFESAAVTAFAVAGGAAEVRLPYVVRGIDLTVDRPFGFLTVHRTSRLVLTAGWVQEPVPFVRRDEDWDEDWDEDRDEDEELRLRTGRWMAQSLSEPGDTLGAC